MMSASTKLALSDANMGAQRGSPRAPTRASIRHIWRVAGRDWARAPARPLVFLSLLPLLLLRARART